MATIHTAWIKGFQLVCDAWAPQKVLVEVQAVVLQIEAFYFALPFTDLRETCCLQRVCRSLCKYQEVKSQGPISHCSRHHVGLNIS